MEIKTEKDKMLFRMQFSGKDAPDCVITTRAAGSMGRNQGPECENRKKIMEYLGTDRIFTVTQEHTRIVHEIETAGICGIKGDGIVTGGRETLAVTVADCVPLFLHDRKTGAYGVVHSGWKGTGIALNALEKMREKYGTAYGDVEAVIGPSIGPCCYSVGKERADEFSAEWGSESVFLRSNVYFLDLRKTNRLILEKAGVKKVRDSNLCTCCGSEFFSYRREGSGRFGLMLALIGFFG